LLLHFAGIAHRLLYLCFCICFPLSFARCAPYAPPPRRRRTGRLGCHRAAFRLRRFIPK